MRGGNPTKVATGWSPDSVASCGLLEMGGRGTDDEDHMVTEAAIRAFYKHYREVMEF